MLCVNAGVKQFNLDQIKDLPGACSGADRGHVYILCSDDYFKVGATTNPQQRLYLQRKGIVRSWKIGAPTRIFFLSSEIDDPMGVEHLIHCYAKAGSVFRPSKHEKARDVFFPELFHSVLSVILSAEDRLPVEFISRLGALDRRAVRSSRKRKTGSFRESALSPYWSRWDELLPPYHNAFTPPKKGLYLYSR
jgi:hypothetical protein